MVLRIIFYYYYYFFASGVGFPLYPEIFLHYSQGSCSTLGSSWEMPDSNPGPLPQKSGPLAMSHHISVLHFFFLSLNLSFANCSILDPDSGAIRIWIEIFGPIQIQLNTDPKHWRTVNIFFGRLHFYLVLYLTAIVLW